MTGSGATYNYKPSDQGPSISQELRPWARNVIYNYAKNVKVGEGITVLGGNSFYKFSALTSVSNIIDPSVPIGKDDSENVEIEKWY